MRARLHGPAPEAGTDFDGVLATLERDVLAYMGRVDHPAYFAFIPGSSTWPGALGDFLASALNIYAGSWMEVVGAEPGRAAGARLVQGVDRLPGRGRRGSC